MKPFLHLCIVFVTMNFIKSNEPAGVRIAVKPDTLKIGLAKYLPLLSLYFKDIKIQDTTLEHDTGLCTLKMNIKNITVTLNDILAENVEITPKEPNKVLLNLAMIGGNGSFNTVFRCGFLPSSEVYTTIEVKRLDALVELSLDHIHHPRIKNKLIPNITMNDLQIPIFEFDFDISLSYVNSVVKFAKNLLKGFLLKSVVQSLKSNLYPEFQMILNEQLVDFPIYVDLGLVRPELAGLMIDTSLSAGFKSIDRTLIEFNLNGGIVNLTVNETLDDNIAHFYDLPTSYEFDYSHDIQIYLSEYFFNKALSTLFKSEKLNYLLTGDMIPQWAAIKLDSTFFNSLFEGIHRRYGKHKKSQLQLKALNEPSITFNNTLTLKLSVQMSIQIEAGSVFEECIILSSDFQFQTEASLDKHQAFMKILSVKFTNSQVVKSLIEEKINITDVENFLNIGSKVLIPMLNKRVEKTIFEPFIFENVEFDQTAVNIRKKYISVFTNTRLMKNETTLKKIEL
jgi:hypothetical protein